MNIPFSKLPILSVNEQYISVFTEVNLETHDRNGMCLTDRIDAQNLRLRQSEPGYQSDWHVAGDPTLIIIQQGALKIILRDGSEKLFAAGERFIAQDYLPEGLNFHPECHGHRAQVSGHQALQAVHIKLASRLEN